MISHSSYIQRVIPNGLDHVRRFKNVFTYVNPPKYESDANEWGFGLKEVAGKKIDELLDRYDFVEKRYKNNCEVIHKLFDKYDDFSSEFYISMEYVSFEELQTIEKWLKYWKRVFEDVSEEKLIEPEKFEDQKFTDEQLDRAREVPIEDMFEGNLKTIYHKQTGLCPFHGEKTPSFTIFVNENKFHCFGCHVHGDAIDFYMKARNVDFIEAVKGLLNE